MILYLSTYKQKVKQIFDPSDSIAPKKQRNENNELVTKKPKLTSPLKISPTKYSAISQKNSYAPSKIETSFQINHEIKFPKKSDSIKLATRLLETQPKSSIESIATASEVKPQEKINDKNGDNDNDSDTCLICSKSSKSSELLCCSMAYCDSKGI